MGHPLDPDKVRHVMAHFAIPGRFETLVEEPALIIDAAHNTALRDILLDHERHLSLSAPAHPWGDRESHRRMESRAAREHDAIVDAIVTAAPDEAAELARRHVQIDLELFSEAREFARRRAAAARD